MATTLTREQRIEAKSSDSEPVLIFQTKSGKLVHAGQPERFDKKLIAQYAKEGYTMRTVTIREFRAKNWTWHWE